MERIRIKFYRDRRSIFSIYMLKGRVLDIFFDLRVLECSNLRLTSPSSVSGQDARPRPISPTLRSHREDAGGSARHQSKRYLERRDRQTRLLRQTTSPRGPSSPATSPADIPYRANPRYGRPRERRRARAADEAAVRRDGGWLRPAWVGASGPSTFLTGSSLHLVLA